mmetsp:Transcript_17252/g.29204  ORF Transcript_17252/g.29204 Transcript_17252/m.29204 type:complete len:261 (-) Transcript_17252:341-1123(-)
MRLFGLKDSSRFSVPRGGMVTSAVGSNVTQRSINAPLPYSPCSISWMGNARLERFTTATVRTAWAFTLTRPKFVRRWDPLTNSRRALMPDPRIFTGTLVAPFTTKGTTNAYSFTSRGAKRMGTSKVAPGAITVGGHSAHSARVFWKVHSMAMLLFGSWLTMCNTVSSMTVLPPGEVTKQCPKLWCMKENRSAGLTPLPRGTMLYTYFPATVKLSIEPSILPSCVGANVILYRSSSALSSVPPSFPPDRVSMELMFSISQM